MEAILTHVAGVDVHKDVLAITSLIGSADEKPKAEYWTCRTYTQDLEECGRKLKSMGIKHVAMESTGIYWKPVYNVWKPMGLQITVGNATHMKNVPGRKTDVKDSQWIAELHRNGLIRSSFIPEPEFQKLRLLNRHRSNLVEDIARIKNRIQKVLEDGNVKIGSVLSNVFGVAGIAVLDAISRGVTNGDDLAACVTTRIDKKEEVVQSLKNCLCEEHRFVIKQLMIQYVDLQKRLDEVEKELDNHLQPHADLIKRLKDIPGVNQVTARGIVAEASTNMEAFGEDRKFAAWCGVAPGNNESAQKKKRSKTRHGNPVLRKILIQSANASVKKKRSFYRAKYNRLKFRLGSANKAKVAIANHIARVVFHVINGEKYNELGYTRVETQEHRIKNLIAKLKREGVEVKYHTNEKIVEAKSVVTITI